MDFEPWWLIIIPVLFALGWVAGRVDFRQMLSETKTLPDSYFKGLNFLLNEQPDRAIDAFIEVAKLDPETTELHFALGSLFRRRGEIERAIRVHQSLLSRSDLPDDLRQKAQYNLAQDFMKAGLLDRAEAVFIDLLNSSYSVSSIKHLIRIYESGHEWDKAIATVQKLQKEVGEPVAQLAHYYCEQALSAVNNKNPDIGLAQSKLDAAQQAIDAVSLDASSSNATKARILILKAYLQETIGNHQKQNEHLIQVLQVAPDYASLIANKIIKYYENKNDTKAGIDILIEHYNQYPSLDVFTVIFQNLMSLNQIEDARKFAYKAMQNNPSLLGLQRVLKLELQYLKENNNIHNQQKSDNDEKFINYDFIDIETLHNIVVKHSNRLDRYLCQSCGFEAQHYYWQCPGCNGWETYKPARLEEIK